MKKSGSVRLNVFICFVGFTILLLGVFWYYQVIQFGFFYKSIRKTELKKASTRVLNSINDENFTDIMETVAQEYDVSINLIDMSGKSIYAINVGHGSHINLMNQKQIDDVRNELNDNGGNLIYEVSGKYRNTIYQTNNEQSMIYTEYVTLADGNPAIFMMSSLITPLKSTVETNKLELVYISFMFVILAGFLGFILSDIISKPIVNINDSARMLAKGRLDVKFDGKGYKEIQELSDTLNFAATELKKSESLQKDIISNVSHDLRTPLTMITAYSEMIKDYPEENTPENIQVIIDEATRLTALVNDMLDLSRLNSGVETLHIVDFNLTKNIDSVIKRVEKFIENNGYVIVFDYKEKVFVNADEYKIYQVMYNLINNALNYVGEDKTVIVRQRCQDNVVRIEIEDHGKGIDPDEIDDIWDRFYRSEKGYKRVNQGTGLGLNIVQHILNLHNAQYGVESEIGKGSVFWFELSIKKTE